MEVVDFTAKSIRNDCKSIKDWLNLKPSDIDLRNTEGRKELKSFLDEHYEKPFFRIELHNEEPISLGKPFDLYFPAYNTKLEKSLRKYTKKMNKEGYRGHVDPSYPSVRPFHSTTIEYYPPSGNNGLSVEDGVRIAEELVKHLQRDYLSLFKKKL